MWNEKGSEYLVKKDYEQAMRCFREADARGNYYAMYNLACMYYFGDGVEKDERTALTWYRRAFEHGDPEAASRVGVMLEQGIGTQQDEEAAFRAYLASAEMGSLSGMANAGRCYMEGIGIRTNRRKGLEWLEKASELGNGVASVMLGRLCLTDGAPEYDRARAARCFQRGVEQEYAPAARMLADLYEQGIGVGRDSEKAAALRRRAEEMEAE